MARAMSTANRPWIFIVTLNGTRFLCFLSFIVYCVPCACVAWAKQCPLQPVCGYLLQPLAALVFVAHMLQE